MISPYVRRHRLAAELRELRASSGVSTVDLAKAIGIHRPVLSNLENGKGTPNLNVVFKILEYLDVKNPKWDEVIKIAREASERGWWVPLTKKMGPRQALYADLEGGATRIRDVQQALIPGLLQTPEYTRARLAESEPWFPRTPGTTVEGILEGRAGRRRNLHRPDGPQFEAILDEIAITRPTASPPILREQYRHIIDVVEREAPRITVLVLPLAAEISAYAVPLTRFSIYDYVDDPPVVSIEGSSNDTVLHEPEAVQSHVNLYNMLREACLSPEASIEAIARAADRLPRT